MRIFKEKEVFFRRGQEVVKANIVRNNGVNAGTYTIEFMSEGKPYSTIMDSKNLFDNKKEVSLIIINDEKRSLESLKGRLERYKKNIEDTKISMKNLNKTISKLEKLYEGD